MNINRIKLITIALFALPFLLLAVFRTTPAGTPIEGFEDAAAVYKAKCMACHTPKATKFYDPAKSDEEHTKVILDGKKGEKPPHMPGYKEKGMSEAEAKALAEYMKGLRAGS